MPWRCTGGNASCVDEGDDARHGSWREKGIHELREELLVDHEEAQNLGVKWQWTIAVTNAHAEIGSLLTQFLCVSSLRLVATEGATVAYLGYFGTK